MAPTTVGEQVLDLVVPYIHDAEDRNSVSLVSHWFYEIDGITRKRLTVHVHYYPNPASLSKRFPFIESLILKGPPSMFNNIDPSRIRITPWIEQLALEFRCLKELCICGTVVLNKDLETLARTYGKDLRTLKIKKCKGFSTHGLMHVSKYCNRLRTFCLGYCNYIKVIDGIWLHQLALNNTVLERLHVRDIKISNSVEELTLLAKNCCNSLISLKIGKCHLSKLGDAFRYAVSLEHFTGDIHVKSQLVGFHFPPNMRSLSLTNFVATRYSIGLPFLNHIRKMKLAYAHGDEDRQYLLFERCPNLEVLYINDQCEDKAMQVIGKFCKKLRKLTHCGVMTQAGLIALAKGCNKIECLKVRLKDISNEAIKFVGTHLKNLRKFRMSLEKEAAQTLDNGIRAMLMGCGKLESLAINLRYGGLTDLALDYIGKYGSNLKSLSLSRVGNSDEGLVQLLKGCPRLRKLDLYDCPFGKQAVTITVFNIPSLRYICLG